MTLTAFLLVLAAAFCHATWNYFVKRTNGGAELIWLFSAVACVLYAPAVAYVLVTEDVTFGLLELGFIFGSTVLHIGYFLLLQSGYRNGDLSLVYPTARATGPCLSVFMAVVFLGEHMSVQAGIGAAVVVFGIVNLTGGFKQRAKHVSASLLFGLGSGMFIGSYTVWDAHAVSVIMIPPLVLDISGMAMRCLILTPVALRRFDLVKTHWRDSRGPVLAVAAFSPLAYILVLYAMSFTPVVYVAPLREISVLITVFMGSVLLGEGDFPRRLFWAVIILSGVSLLATG